MEYIMAYKKVKLADVLNEEPGSEVQVTGYLGWNSGKFTLSESQDNENPVLYLDESDPGNLCDFISLVFPDGDEKTNRNITVSGTLDSNYLKDVTIVKGKPKPKPEPVKDEEKED